MLNHDVACVPEDERHRAPWLCGSFFRVVPRVAAAVDASCPVAVDVYPLAAEDKAGGMVLEGDWVRVVAPVVQVVRELPRASAGCNNVGIL